MATKKEFKLGKLQKKWVNELKSGKYKKSKYLLNSKGGYCCLGIICEIENVLVKEKGKPSYIKGSRNKENQELTKSLYNKYGLRFAEGKLKERYKNSGFLSQLNDGVNMSLKQIGEYIEQNPENVFTKSC